MKSILLFLLVYIFVSGCAQEPVAVNAPKPENQRILMPEQVFIYPNQDIFLLVKLENNKVIILEQLKTKPEGKEFIEVKYEKMGSDTLLMISNPFDWSIKFHADLVDVQGRHRETSSCPIVPKGTNYEQWPGIVFKIALSDFHIATKQNEGCVY